MATREEAKRVAADLTAKAEAEPDTRAGIRARRMWYAAVAAIQLHYGLDGPGS